MWASKNIFTIPYRGQTVGVFPPMNGMIFKYATNKWFAAFTIGFTIHVIHEYHPLFHRNVGSHCCQGGFGLVRDSVTRQVWTRNWSQTVCSMLDTSTPNQQKAVYLSDWNLDLDTPPNVHCTFSGPKMHHFWSDISRWLSWRRWRRRVPNHRWCNLSSGFLVRSTPGLTCTWGLFHHQNQSKIV